ncbi:MAG: ABC transporter substrate-binding protein [Promethearchaeota archaeon]
MELEKKDTIIIILIFNLMVSGIGNLFLSGTKSVPIRPRGMKNVLKCGGTSDLVLDPVDSRDSALNTLIRHVCDNLWYYDLYDPDFALEMRLATNYIWNPGLDELTVILREHVFFHDGSYFNATAVQFTFDRILYFINATGTLDPSSHLADSASLFYDINGKSILNKTVINSEYNITFILNKPYGVFISLLSYESCAILHPKTTPATTYLQLGVDLLVGTGPFKYELYRKNEELRIVRWSLYWGPNTFWDEILWIYYPDTITENNALLGGEIHFLGEGMLSYIHYFQTAPYLAFINLNTSTDYTYLGINNNIINITNIRKAIAYAYNYSYYIDVIKSGYAIRAHQFLPPGFPYYNESFRAPSYNTTIARLAMKAAFPAETAGLTPQAYGVNASNDAAWTALTLASYKVLEIEDNTLSQKISISLANDMDRIGINITSDIMDYPTLNEVLVNDKDRLNIWYTEWAPDYIDPFNMIEPLLNNMSLTNRIQINNVQIMQWLKEYEETDPDNITKRAELLWNIQQRAINELYVELPLCYDNRYYVHHKSLAHICYNILGHFWFRDTYLIPGVPTI